MLIEEIPIEKLKGKRVLVITACSRTKLGNIRKVKAKAKDMYQGRLFKLVRKLCESRKWDYVIISAKYGLLFPEEEVEGYDKVLKTKKDIEEIKLKVIPKLRETIARYDNVIVIAGKKYSFQFSF